MTQQPWGQPAPQQAPWGQQAAPQQAAPQQWGQPQQTAPQSAPWGQPQQQAPAYQPPAQQPRAAQSDDDPFAVGQKTPSISFKDAPVGSAYVLRIAEQATQRQQINFDTGQLDFWEPNEAQRQQGMTVGDPKMAAVLRGTVLQGPPQEIGQERSVWAPLTSKPGSMCAAIGEAQRTAGERIGPGGTLTITLVGLEDPPPNQRNKSPRKLYAAKYDRPGPGSAGDAFAAAQPTYDSVGTLPPSAAQQAYQPAPAPQQAPPPDWAQQPAPAQQVPQDAPPASWGQQAAQPGTMQHFQQVGAQGVPQDAQQTSQPAPAAAPPSSPWG